MRLYLMSDGESGSDVPRGAAAYSPPRYGVEARHRDIGSDTSTNSSLRLRQRRQPLLMCSDSEP